MTIGNKFIVVFSIFFVTTLGGAFFVFNALKTQQADKTAIDLAGRQRMLTQKYFKEYNHLDEIDNWNLVIDDAKHFLSNTDKKFDLVNENLCKMVESSYKLKKSLADKKGVTLKFIDKCDPSYSMNKMVSSIFANLIDNAIKYSPKGGVVLFKAVQNKNRIRVEVIDEGKGIPDKD